MKINDKLSVLFLLEKPKMDKKGRTPIYVRITVEGSPRAEMSFGRKVFTGVCETRDGENKSCP
jgi:hypothetical protein